MKLLVVPAMLVLVAAMRYVVSRPYSPEQWTAERSGHARHLTE